MSTAVPEHHLAFIVQGFSASSRCQLQETRFVDIAGFGPHVDSTSRSDRLDDPSWLGSGDDATAPANAPGNWWETLWGAYHSACSQYFVIPAADQWGNPECYGGNADCGDLCLNPKTLDDLRAIVPGDETSVIVKNAHEDEEEILRTAWGILRRNPDLMAWSLCKGYKDRITNQVYGSVEVFGKVLYRNEGRRIARNYENIKRKLTEGLFERTGARRISIHMHNTRTGGMFLEPKFQGSWIGHGIWISRFSRSWDRKYRRIWNEGESDADRFCAAVDLAATLYHELLHVLAGDFDETDHRQCYDPDDEDGESHCDCDEMYLSENVFRWALYQRYSEASSSECCLATAPAYSENASASQNLLARDSIYYYDRSLYPGVSACLPKRDSRSSNPWWDELSQHVVGIRAPEPSRWPSLGEEEEGYDLPFSWWNVLESYVS